MAFVSLAGIAWFFVLRYPIHGYVYPVGWDAPWYVWRANAVSFDGLSRLGDVRASSPLILSMLGGLTGQNSFTMVTLAAPTYAGVAGLAVAAMLRSALGTKLVWVPVIGLLTWVAFGGTDLLGGHTDEALNVSLVLAGFAAAVTLLSGGRGAIATALLFMGAGLAEWPFFGFAMAVFGLALVLFVVPIPRSTRPGRPAAVARLAWAMIGSVIFAVMTLVGIPSVGHLDLRVARGSEGASLGRRLSPGGSMRSLLKQRFRRSITHPSLFLSLGLMTAGGWVAAVVGVEEGRRDARRLFVSLMLSWLIMTAGAAAAQFAGLPVAGARLLLYFFAAPILTAVVIWGGARLLAQLDSRPVATAAAVVLVLGAVGAFATHEWSHDHPQVWLVPSGIQQVASAGAYLMRFAANRDVVFSLAEGEGLPIARWKNTIRAALPAPEVARLRGWTTASASELVTPSLNGTNEGQAQGDATPVVIVLREYSGPVFPDLFPEGYVSPGVLALNGPVPRTVLPSAPRPQANVTWLGLLWLVPSMAAILFVVGGGWAAALLPADLTVQSCLAPAMGLAMASLIALLWDRLGLSFHGWLAVGPLVLTAISGWGLTRFMRTKALGAGSHRNVQGTIEASGQ